MPRRNRSIGLHSVPPGERHPRITDMFNGQEVERSTQLKHDRFSRRPGHKSRRHPIGMRKAS